MGVCWAAVLVPKFEGAKSVVTSGILLALCVLLLLRTLAWSFGALMKLVGGSPAFAHELSADAFLQQVGGVWAC